MTRPGFYVGGPDRKDFKTLKAARAFFEANPDYVVLGRWVETVRTAGIGPMRSRSGKVIEDRRKA